MTITQLFRIDAREPYLQSPELCYYCGDLTMEPVVIAGRTFCGTACAKDYAE